MAQMEGVAPPGWERTVKKMKKSGDIDNPYALSWWLKRRGAHPSRHSDADATFEDELQTAIDEAKALMATRQIPDVFFAAARGEANACSLLLNATGKLYVEQRRW